MLIHSSLENETGALNTSQAGNITRGNNTIERNSSVEEQNVTSASNASDKIVLANNTKGQNSSVEAQKDTLADNSGPNAVNVTEEKCFETKTLLAKAYVKEFFIEYSDNGNLWRQYYEGGYLKVFVFTNSVFTLFRNLA